MRNSKARAGVRRSELCIYIRNGVVVVFETILAIGARAAAAAAVKVGLFAPRAGNNGEIDDYVQYGEDWVQPERVRIVERHKPVRETVP